MQTYIRIAETVGIIRLVGAKRKRIEKQRRSERHRDRKRRRRKADNTLQGQAVFKCVRYYCFCSCRLPVRRNIFTDCSRGCRTTVIFFLLSQASVLPFSLPFFDFHPPSSKAASSTLVSSVANPRCAKTDTSVPFRVYHQALLLIVGKYSDTVTRGEFHERSNLCAPQEHRVVTWA